MGAATSVLPLGVCTTTNLGPAMNHLRALIFGNSPRIKLGEPERRPPTEIQPPRDHINMRTLPTVISGIPLIVDPGTRMGDPPYVYTVFYHTILYHEYSMPYYNLPYSIIPYYNIPYCAITYYNILYYHIPHYTLWILMFMWSFGPLEMLLRP